MDNSNSLGNRLRLQIKDLVLNFIAISTNAKDTNNGLKTAEIFRACGLDWGDYQNATSSQQQFWLVGLLRELEKENKIQRNSSKLWRIKDS